MKKNYHTHTVRCHHAVGSEREYIEKAIEAGFELLGFSDHSPYIFKDGHYSSFRMRPEELPGYVSTLRALREEYADRIDIRIGLETEYYPDNWEDYKNLIRGSGVEYLIQGQHFVRGEAAGEPYSGKDDDDRDRVEAYISSAVAAARSGMFSYFAHPDMLYFSGDQDWFRERMEYMVRQVQREDLPFEINLLGLREGRHYPSRMFLEILRDNHATVVLGSDAHAPKYVYHQETVERALSLVKEYHLTLTEEIDVTRLAKKGF